MKKLIKIVFAILITYSTNAQIIVIDPGHGYGATTSNNPDGRTATEIETALEVGLRTRTLIQNSCSAWTVQMTRTTNLNSWISVTQRAQMANNWNADRLLSIHCNAGGGTGTETFYCTDSDTSTAPDIAFAQKIQTDMVANGALNNRRCVEDNSFLAYHLGVLKYSSATGCLNEIGFVDSADATKLTSSAWRDTFALSYFNSLKANLNLTCNAIPLPGVFTLTATPECNGATSQIKLTWTTSSNATNYDIYRNGSLYASNVTGTQFLNTFITIGTVYTYSVKAKNATGTTLNSNGTLSATAINCPPGAFTVTATPTCSGTTSAINLTWTTSANATSYDIYRNGNLYAPDVTGTTFLNTYLISAGTTYTYSVKAKNSIGTLNNSNGTLAVTAINCTAKMAETETTTQLNTPQTEIALYPNPTSGIFNLAVNNAKNERIEYYLFDSNGKMINNAKIDSSEEDLNQQIDISHLPKGIYFARILIANREYNRKIIKQ